MLNNHAHRGADIATLRTDEGVRAKLKPTTSGQPLPIIDAIPVELKNAAASAVSAFRDHRSGGLRRQQGRRQAIAALKSASAELTALQLANIASRRAGGTVEDETQARAALDDAKSALNALPANEDGSDDAVAVILRERLLTVEAEINSIYEQNRAALLPWLSEIMIEAGRLASLAEAVGRAAGYNIDFRQLPSDPISGDSIRIHKLPPDVTAIVECLDDFQRVAGPVFRTIAL